LRTNSLLEIIKKDNLEEIENRDKNKEKIFDVTIKNSKDLDINRLRDY
jgi:hypothetical protein